MASNLKHQAPGAGSTAPDQGGHGGRVFDASAAGVRRRAERRAEDRARHATQAFTEAHYAAPSGEMPEALQAQTPFGWHTERPKEHRKNCACRDCYNRRDREHQARLSFARNRQARAHPSQRQMPRPGGPAVELLDQMDVHALDRENDRRIGLMALHERGLSGHGESLYQHWDAQAEYIKTGKAKGQAGAHLLSTRFASHLAYEAACAAYRAAAGTSEKQLRRLYAARRTVEDDATQRQIATELQVSMGTAHNYQHEGLDTLTGYYCAEIDKERGTIKAI